MADDTFTASDFTSAEASISSEPATGVSEASGEASAPVETAAQLGEATTQPAAVATTTPLSTEPAKPAGPIPFEVHKTALENARTKAVEELRARVGWAEQVDPQEFQQIQHLARTLQADPVAGLQQLMAEIRKNPQHDAAIRSLAARALAQRQQGQATEQEPQLEMIPVQLEDGRVVKFATAESTSAREAWIQRKATEAAAAQFQPHLQTLQGLQQQRDALAQQQQVEHFVSTTFADMQTWPGMDSAEAKAAVAKELAQAQINPNDPREVAMAVDRAYRKAVLPTLHTASRQAVLNDINRQAAASSVNPSQSGTRAPKSMDEMSISEALQYVAAQRA